MEPDQSKLSILHDTLSNSKTKHIICQCEFCEKSFKKLKNLKKHIHEVATKITNANLVATHFHKQEV